MAVFRQSYPSEHSPEQLWQAINTPLIDPDIAALVHEDLLVTYEHLAQEGLIEGGTIITYVPTDEAKEKVPSIYQSFIPKDVAFYVTRMSVRCDPSGETLRHDVLMSGKADGWVTRTVEADADASKLSVEAELTISGIGNMFDEQIAQALEHVFGGPSERTIALATDILGV